MASMTPIIGDVATVAEAAGKIAALVQQYESEHNTPGMLQAAIADKWQKDKEAAEKAVLTENAEDVGKGIS